MFSPPFLHLTFFFLFFLLLSKETYLGLIHPFLLRNERISLSRTHFSSALFFTPSPLGAERGTAAGWARAGPGWARGRSPVLDEPAMRARGRSLVLGAGASQSPPSSAPPLMEAVGAGQRRRNGRATAGQGTLVIQRCLGKQKKKEKILNGEKRRKHLFSTNSRPEC